MTIITGACGFIGSCLLSFLNQKGCNNIIIVDDFSEKKKNLNLDGKEYLQQIHRLDFIDWFNSNSREVKQVYHLGARTNTLSVEYKEFEKLNFIYSKELWKICARKNIPFIYASSAATYGKGEFGYDDSHKIIDSLYPLNPYAVSKNEFDKWVLKQEDSPDFWSGLKLFNVYGPNEYHKDRMASVIYHAYNTIIRNGELNLFRSHNDQYKDGEQKRDFIYVKDVVKVLYFMMNNETPSGIYNLGTGEARTFYDLAIAVFESMNKQERISFIDTPIEIRDKYQYYTKANINKLRKIGYNKRFSTLEEGIVDYVSNYLLRESYL